MSAGWLVRGTTRDPAATPDILAAGLEAAVADPDRAGSILELVGDVTLVFWLLGSARGDPALVGAINGPRLERLLEKLVDTPVRGFVYEAVGSVEPRHLRRGREAVQAAEERWRIPVVSVDREPRDWEAWVDSMLGAAERLVGGAD